MSKAWLAAIAVFLVSCNGLRMVVHTTCGDGWHSPSIGRRGACSHHGGVDRIAGNLVLFGSGAAAWLAWSYIENREERRRQKERDQREKSRKSQQDDGSV